ncbi:NAD(P)/FAD-dependent oxidoreductase [Flavihumibacter stibioxidans]|uniref:Flavoprotein n=1 Tax=Flavihumibacter stibioxidans TaxID=1834163 RepID=A0ABR7M5Y6_9BACT|nr:NAD(P)/FAD-dependent oxidoreductase [Flavihumibacter stibioxidans]MBC6490013.1 flavoprotein [Flavihumibacter stibioxidans]
MRQQILVVIGGGAAGFFCAVNAAAKAPGLKVVVLEKSSKLLAKVRISGGGRCNVTHSCFDVPALAKKYPRGGNFVKKTFARFGPADTIKWFGERGVVLKAEEDGRMFPVTNDSSTIIDCLLREANRLGIDIRLNQDVQKVERSGEKWIIQSSRETIHSDFLCIASGGFPRPAMFDWITATGHSIESPVPSLFTFNLPTHPLNALMGLVVQDAQVRINSTKLSERGPVLITHWGLSGPAILRLSAWGARDLAEKDWHFKIQVNWVPAYNENSLRDFFQQYRFEKAPQKMTNRNPFGLPQRFWDFLLGANGIGPETRWSDLPAKEQNKLVKNLASMDLEVKGKTTFKEEFVTAGGIKLSEVDPDTMQSRLHPRLYFAGEILDVDGITGGFNFQHAWTSGFIAAQSIAASCHSAVAEGSL